MSEVNSSAAPAVADASAPAEVSSPEVQSPESIEAELNATPAPEAEAKVKEAIKDGASKEEIKKMIKEFELKVNGKSVKKSIDLNDEKALMKELQLAAASQEAWQENAEIKKLLNSELDRLKNSPFEVLKELGHDPDKLIEEYVTKMLEESKKSPEQVEKEKLQKELEDLRAKEKQRDDEHKKDKARQLFEQEQRKLDGEMKEALEKRGIPKTRRMVSKIADVMSWAIDNGYEDISVEDAIPVAEQELMNEMNEMFDEKPLELLEKYIGEKNLERWRSNKVNKIKESSRAGTGQNTKVAQTTSSAAKVSESSKKEPLNLKEAMAKMMKDIGN